MQILKKKYNPREKTTLNRMRKNKTSNSKAFKILIACLLSLRARDESTEKISEQLFKIAETPKAIAKIPTKKLEKIIFSSGHYHKKAQTLKHVSQEILKRFNGKVPSNREQLLSIKGIGPKTANIVLNFAYGICIIPVDVHVHVATNRLGWISTKNAEKSETELNTIIPNKYKYDFNALFVLFGREICQTFSPKCSICPIKQYCPRIGVKRSR
ncbi:MAG: endonuclease III [Nanoarchaeota archaeon]|nr:endonuclease III [Nanoarchaeota archaeon]